ncbi:MAG: LuxR C-terminal-related transcriptional regulator [Gemmatimonadales bacterium]|nr:LuxR C-terminal-related transcriptional regulator [Gemmatimonadales bacterium]
MLRQALSRQTLVFGLLGGLLIALLRAIEYRFLVVEHSLELYGGLVAVLFVSLGLWLGRKLVRPTEVVREVTVEVPVEVRVPVPAGGPFERDRQAVDRLGITPRELEVLEMIAQGLSNREIAERCAVTENTVKTHASRLLDKLGAKRRTHAVQLGKQFRLIP